MRHSVECSVVEIPFFAIVSTFTFTFTFNCVPWPLPIFCCLHFVLEDELLSEDDNVGDDYYIDNDNDSDSDYLLTQQESVMISYEHILDPAAPRRRTFSIERKEIRRTVNLDPRTQRTSIDPTIPQWRRLSVDPMRIQRFSIQRLSIDPMRSRNRTLSIDPTKSQKRTSTIDYIRTASRASQTNRRSTAGLPTSCSLF